MACCGKERGQYQHGLALHVAPAQPASTNSTILARRVAVLFEYNGNSSLTIHGLVSGKLYSFDRPGAISEVDERDRNLLLAMPSLRQL